MIEGSGAATGTPRSWLAQAVFGLDNVLRHRRGVFEYTAEAECILRAELARLEHEVDLPDGTTLPAGELVVRLHLWNEHIPALPREGATLNWARRMNRSLDASLCRLAAFMHDEPGFDSVVAVHSELTFGTNAQMGQLLRICRRYDFLPAPPPAPQTPMWRLHRQGENMLIAFLVLARNPRAFRLDCLRRDRADVYLPRKALDARYIGAAAPSA